MAVEYEISSDVATIKGVAPNTQVARVVSLYSGQITYDDEAGSKFATATIDGKSQRVMLCIAVNGTVNYDDVPCLYSTVDGHRCLNIVAPTETGTPDDVPSVNETVVIDGKNVRAVRCILINATPVYDGVSSVCTFTGDDGKTHTAQLVNKISGGGAIEVIVRGSEYIVLPDAIADSLEYLKAFGGTEQRNIPQPYTQVNYVTNIASTAVDTGVMIDFSKNYEFEVECRAVSGSWYILQSRASSTGNVTGIHGATSGSTIILVVGNVTVCTSAITRTVGNKLYVKATLNAGTATLYVKDETANTEDTQTGSYGTSQPNPTAAVYLLGNAGGQYADINSDIYMARIKENDTVVMDYVPARQVATAGFYDTVSGTFKTALTPANLSADGNTVPTPDAPVDIVSNNGVIKFGQYGKNLNVGELSNQGYSSTGGISTSATLCGTLWKIKVNPGEKYTVSYGNFPDGISGMYISTWLADGTWNSRQAASFSGSYTYTIPAGVGEVNFTLYKTGGATIADNSWIQVEAGETATDYEPAHFGLHTDGTVETINVHGKNLFDGVIELGSINPADGSLVVNNSRTRSANFIPVQPNTTYTFTRENSAEIRWIVGYDKDKNGITDGTPNQPAALTNLNSSSVMSKTFTTTPTTHYIKWYDTSNAGLNEKVQIEVGSTATDYEPYYNGGTATAEMLLKVGDYQDEQEITTGAVTRKVGVYVFDGSETITYQSQSVYPHTFVYNATNKISGVTGIPTSTHFNKASNVGINNVQNNYIGGSGSNGAIVWIRMDNMNSVAEFKTWLSEQYAAGTPVIIVYPLETPTTESVAGQTMQVQQGDNVVEITQASLNGLELEAKYQAAVSLTIQEVQDANLDPNVQVTIN